MLKRIVAIVVAVSFAFAGSMGACGISMEQCAGHEDACGGHDEHGARQAAPHDEHAPDSDAPSCHGCVCPHGHSCAMAKVVLDPSGTIPDCSITVAYAFGGCPRLPDTLAEIFIPPKIA